MGMLRRPIERVRTREPGSPAPQQGHPLTGTGSSRIFRSARAAEQAQGPRTWQRSAQLPLSHWVPVLLLTQTTVRALGMPSQRSPSTGSRMGSSMPICCHGGCAGCLRCFQLAVSARPQWPGMASVLRQLFTSGLQAAGVCRSAQGYGDGGGRHGEANGGHVVAHCPASMFRVGSTAVPDLVFPLKSAG